MTAQISDTVIYKGEKYDLTAYSGEGLFDPNAHGLKPTWSSSGCWRGFVCPYSIDRQALFLDALRIKLQQLPAPVLFGVHPKPEKGISLDGITLREFSVIYRRMHFKVPYTGGLLLARNFIKELYVHMGHHHPWKYREIHEVIFDKGNVLMESDRSKQMAGFREAMIDRPLEPAFGATRKEIETWVQQCFDQRYRW